MNFLSYLIRKPLSVLLFFILLLGFGTFVATQLPIDLLPSVEIPTITVTTAYPGASSEEVEQNVTSILEESFRAIDKVDSISSTSSFGTSQITVEFDFGSDLEINVNNLRENLDLISGALPPDADKPLIFRFNPSDIPIMEVAISANRSADEIRNIVNNTVSKQFERIDGVTFVFISGGADRRYFVDASLNRLKAYNLNLGDLKNVLLFNSIRAGVGNVETDVQNISFLVEGKFQSIEEINNLVVGSGSSETNTSFPILMRDVANVYEAYDDSPEINLLDGIPTVTAYFFKRSDANIVEVATNIKKAFEYDIPAASPSDFRYEILDDNSEFIQGSLSAVSRGVLGGAVLAVIVIILFLRNFNASFAIALSIPVSVVATLMLMNFFGLSLNIMSVAGLALGVGMLVDNSIVVLENIYKKRMKGVRLLSASEYGAKEMSRPILASTLTTISVFVPIVIFRNELGVIGAFFSVLGYTIVIALITSYITAIVLIPILSSKFLALHKPRHRFIFKYINSVVQILLDFVHKVYNTVLSWCLRHRKLASLIIFIIVISPLPLARNIPFEFQPDFSNSQVVFTIQFPAGSRLDTMLAQLDDISLTVGEYIPAYDKVGMQATETGSFFLGASAGSITYYLSEGADVDTRELRDISKKANDFIATLPGLKVRVGGEGRGGPPQGGNDFQLVLGSSDLDILQANLESVMDIIDENIEGLVSLDNDFPEGNPQVSLFVDRLLASRNGVNVSSVTNELTTALRGERVASFVEDGIDYQVKLRLQEEDRNRTDIVELLDIRTPRGIVPMSNFVRDERSVGLSEIKRKNLQKTITISAGIAPGYDILDVVNPLQELLPNVEGLTYKFEGEYESIRSSQNTAIAILIIAVAFVFVIMASQFESLLDPFIILFTIPLVIGGVFLLYFIVGSSFSAFTVAGVVLLVGVAVNHGIVLVDYMNVLRKRGHNLFDATLQGANERLQPILMTGLTTIMGLTPLAFLNIVGSELIKPLALTVVGGLFSSVFLSLFFVPVLYLSFNRSSIKVKNFLLKLGIGKTLLENEARKLNHPNPNVVRLDEKHNIVPFETKKVTNTVMHDVYYIRDSYRANKDNKE